MDEPVIAASAHRHGVDDATILHSFANPIRVEDLDEGFTMLIGPDTAGNLYEIGVVESSDGPVIVQRNARPPQVPQVNTMPRSIEEILEQADELADRFEQHEPRSDVADAAALRALRAAFVDRAAAERRLADAVSIARAEGHSWAAIGAMIGTSGEAARQRYGRPARRR